MSTAEHAADLPAPSGRPRRLVYLGTPDAAVPPLRALHDAGFEIPLVVSRPDAKRGRGGALLPSPVKGAGLELGLRVTDDLGEVAEVGADLGVVVAYGRILKVDLLRQLPMVNLHFSLLPRWRGAAPVERAILAGDDVTGVCVMQVAEGLDTGDVYSRATVDIGAGESAASLRGRLAEIGAELLVSTLVEGLAEPEPQQGEATYADKITTHDLHLDWCAPAGTIVRQVRVGGAWTELRGARFKVWDARQVDPAVDVDGTHRSLAPGALDGELVGTGDGVVQLVEVQAAGKPRQAFRDWANGARPTADDRFV